MFKLSSKITGETAAFEYPPATASETYTMGEVLKMSSGAVTKASGTDTPEFLCLADMTAASGDTVPAMRITDLQEFETTFAAAATAVKAGNYVTIHSDGAQVTATTENGVFLVSRMDGTAVGSKVRGYFHRKHPEPVL